MSAVGTKPTSTEFAQRPLLTKRDIGRGGLAASRAQWATLGEAAGGNALSVLGGKADILDPRSASTLCCTGLETGAEELLKQLFDERDKHVA